MTMAARCNATMSGSGDPAIVFVHGFGCDQHMWRHVTPAFASEHRVVTLDLVGSGGSDLSCYDEAAYSELEAHAADVVALCRELDLTDVVLVGHSVSAMIAVLAHNAAPDLITRLVLVAPSARYIDDVDYRGGFTAADIDDLLALMASNHLGWQEPLSQLVMTGVGEGEDHLRGELEESFCRTRPDIAAHFAGVTFRGDNRGDLPLVTAPTLVLQSSVDAVAPHTAGEYVRDHIRGSTYQVIDTHGHCPHLSAPAETVDAIQSFLRT